MSGFGYEAVERMIREGGRLAEGDVVDLRTGRRFRAVFVHQPVGPGVGPTQEVELLIFAEALDPEALAAAWPVFKDGSPVPFTQ